jgi:hypothetical protein
VLTAAAAPGWIALILLAAGTVAVRRAGYPRLISRL